MSQRCVVPGANALSFFYYSGHGVANPETQINYLIPVDVSDADDDKVWFESFQQNTIIDLLSKQAPNATHYVVFDACRNELNIAGTAAKALGTDKGFVPITDTAGLLIAYATAPRKTASDVGDDGGPYAKVLAEELMRPGIEAVTMFRNVQLRVKQTIGQDPWLSFPSLPAVYFAGTNSQEDEELVFWDSLKDRREPAALTAYLERYPDGTFASIGKALIDQLEQQLKAEQAAREEARRRQEEARTAADARRLEDEHRALETSLANERRHPQRAAELIDLKRLEEQQRTELALRSEELNKALEAARLAREAANTAEMQRIAAVRAAEEAAQAAEVAAKRAGGGEKMVVAALPKVDPLKQNFDGNWTFRSTSETCNLKRGSFKAVIRGTTLTLYFPNSRTALPLRIDASGSIRGTVPSTTDQTPVD